MRNTTLLLWGLVTAQFAVSCNNSSQKSQEELRQEFLKLKFGISVIPMLEIRPRGRFLRTFPQCLLLALIIVMLGSCRENSQFPGSTTASDLHKPRVVVTTDPELDDSNSLIRYLLYSTDFQTEGLIYASSGFHWKGDGKGTKWFVPDREYTRFGLDICPCESWRWAEGERFIHDAVETYEKVYANLKVHHPEYPSPAELKSKIRIGNVEFDGDISKDSPGSDLIKSLLLEENDTPLYLLAWGGQSTIARALKSIQEEHEASSQWLSIRRSISHKAIIQSFGDQDDTYAKYIKPNWPEIEYREMSNQTFGYGARGAVLAQDQVYLTASWTKENVSSRGPLGKFYRVWGDGKQMVENDIFDYFGFSGISGEQLKAMGYMVWMPVQEEGSWISEGDTPTFLNLVNNGLRAYEHPTYGSWGGRQGEDIGPDGPDPHYAIARFFGTAQRDFAARLLWSVTPGRDGANHEPLVEVNVPMDISARAGDIVQLEGSINDPDDDKVQVRWWQYVEAGSYPGRVRISDPEELLTSLLVPANATPGSTIHLILEATDDGTPALTRYQRIIVTVTN